MPDEMTPEGRPTSEEMAGIRARIGDRLSLQERHYKTSVNADFIGLLSEIDYLLAQAQRDAEAVEVSRKNAREGWAAAHAAVDRAIAAEQENARLRERIESGKQAVELRERALAAAEQEIARLKAGR